jgi:hypothetical protein
VVPSALRRPARHLRRGAPLQRRTRRSRGADPASPPNRLNPRGVRLTFGAHSTRRIGLSGSRSPCGLSQAPGVFRRAAGLGRLLDLLASLPWPSPLLQGCHSRPPAALRPLGRRATRLSWGFLPFSTCQTRGSTCAGAPISPLRSGPRVSTLSPASSPRALPALFHAGALLGFALQGFLLRVRRHLLRGPSPPRRWPPAGCTLRGGKERTESAAHPASPSSRLLVPGVRMLRPAVRQSPKSAPLVGFILPEACDPPAAPPRPGGHPPLGFRTTFGLAPCGRPGPPGSSTASGLTRLQEPGSLSEVLSPL